MSDAPILRAGKHCQQVSELTHGIYRVADALCRLGIPAGLELQDIADRIDAEAREANRCIGQSINENFERTQQATNNMVAAALTANLISRKEKH